MVKICAVNTKKQPQKIPRLLSEKTILTFISAMQKSAHMPV